MELPSTHTFPMHRYQQVYNAMSTLKHGEVVVGCLEEKEPPICWGINLFVHVGSMLFVCNVEFVEQR